MANSYTAVVISLLVFSMALQSQAQLLGAMLGLTEHTHPLVAAFNAWTNPLVLRALPSASEVMETWQRPLFPMDSRLHLSHAPAPLLSSQSHLMLGMTPSTSLLDSGFGSPHLSPLEMAKEMSAMSTRDRSAFHFSPNSFQNSQYLPSIRTSLQASSNYEQLPTFYDSSSPNRYPNFRSFSSSNSPSFPRKNNKESSRFHPPKSFHSMIPKGPLYVGPDHPHSFNEKPEDHRNDFFNSQRGFQKESSMPVMARTEAPSSEIDTTDSSRVSMLS